MKNRRTELFPILNLLDPKSFRSEADFIRLSYNTPELHKVLNKFMFRRSKAQVIKELPPMERIDHTFELTPKAMKIYQKIEQGIIGFINEQGEFIKQDQIMHVIAKLNKLRQIVSYSAIEHTADLAMNLYNDAVDNEHNKKKVIIFSYYKLSVYEIAKRLGNEAIAFTGEDKNKNGYMDYVEEFQTSPDKNFLVMQLMTGGEGFDITEAENVIFNDMWWTPAAHEQAEGRCYGRLNDMHGAKSFWLMAEDTISEMVSDMLQSKLREIAQCIDGAAKDQLRNTSVAKELIKELRKKKRS
jgi:SNF2 family DNA or RNA helicase